MVQCRALEVSASGYRQHRARRTALTASPSHRVGDGALLVHVRAIFHEMKGAYGWPRVWRELRDRDIRAGKERVRKLMKADGLRARGKRKFRVTTDSPHGLPVSPNLLERKFVVAEPNRVWTGSITYVWTDLGWLYLAVVINLFSRRIVGFSMNERLAWFRRRPAPELIFHSDRSSKYASGDFQKQLKDFGIRGSMSLKGDCWANAVTETLLGSLKVERLHGMRFATRRQAKDETMDWMQLYNHKRFHSTLGYVSPVTFDARHEIARKESSEEERNTA